MQYKINYKNNNNFLYNAWQDCYALCDNILFFLYLITFAILSKNPPR